MTSNAPEQPTPQDGDLYRLVITGEAEVIRGEPADDNTKEQ